MSVFRVEVLPEAERDFREAFLWYFERSPLAADAFRVEVLDAIDGLAESASSWPVNEDNFHFYVLTRFPYTIFYELVNEIATVVAVAHQKRRPGYWHAQRK